MDTKFKTRVNDFLAQKNIAFAGYSSKGTEVANHLYNKFKKNAYNVFAVNPKFEQVKDVECFPDLKPDIFHACFKWILNLKGKLKIEDSQKNRIYGLF